MREFRARHQREQLHRAARDGDLAAVRLFLQRKYPLNRFDEIGKTPLHYAVQEGHVFIVEELLAAGADVNANDARRLGNTPLNDNIDSCSIEMAEVLIGAGADPTLPGWMGKSALDNVQTRKDADAERVRQLLKEALKRKNDGISLG